MCINISGVELTNENFPPLVKRLLETHKVSPCSVELEVTETALVAGDKACLETLNVLNALGVLHIPANPDTGTGLIRTPVFLAFL